MRSDETGIHAASAEGSNATSSKSSPSNIDHESPQQRQLDCLASFLTLPIELQQRIVALACGPPTIDRWTLAGRSTSCTTTMLRLLETAQVFYPLVTPLLYRHVRLTRPSALHAFARTLCAKPALGQLLESLHLGEDEELPLEWWPILAEGTYGSNPKALKLDLASGDWRDSARLELDIHGFDRDVVRADALRQAFQVAREYLNVSMEEPRYEGPPRREYRNEWCVNIFKLKAVMELYYLKMLRLEEANKDGVGEGQKRGSKRQKTRNVKQAPFYPRLSLGSSALLVPSSEEDGKDVFRIDDKQILERLRTHGSPTDTFNHPYLFSQSGMHWSAGGPDRAYYYGDETNAKAVTKGQASAASTASTDGCLAASPSSESGLSDSSAPAVATTVLENVALAHRVLTLAPQIRCLSVTGIFELVVGGEHPPLFRQLHSLTIGPRPSAWREPLHLTHRELDSVVRLRLCGFWIKHEAPIVSGNNEALRRLSEFQWSTTLEYSGDAIPTLLNVVTALQGQQTSTASSNDEPLVNESLRSGSKEPSHDRQPTMKSDVKGSARVSPCYMEVRLHPNCVQSLLDAAPSKEVARAWRAGEAIPGKRNRIKIVPQTRVRKRLRLFLAYQELYDEGREWWEES